MIKTRTAPKPQNVYDTSNREPIAIEELRGAIKYRELILQLVRRDIVTRYKRSALGIIWTMLTPLATMIILTVVFSTIFKSIQGFPIYILSGLIAWTFFSQATMASLNQMVWGGSLLHRIYLPRTSFVLSAIGTGLFNFALSLVPMILIMLVIKFPIRITMLFLPVAMFFLAIFALGIGLLFSTLAVYFPDVVDMFQVILNAWMYITPIIYPADLLPPGSRDLILYLNPMYYLIELFREPVYGGIIPSWRVIITGGFVAVITLVIGWIVFSRRANEFTYRT
jgi:ABC-2 type transport system permease protein